MTLNDWFLSIAAALGDDQPGREFHRYKLRDMQAAYYAAMCLAAKYRDDLFTEYVKVKLQPGRAQDMRNCCSKVLGLVDQIDSKGNILRKISKGKTAASTKWKKPSCFTGTTGGYSISDWEIDAVMKGQFTVEPPVPCDVDAYVTIKCVKNPTTCTDLDVEMEGDCTLATAAWHYVLGRMLAGDRHAAGATSESQLNYKMFFEILGVVQKAEERVENAVR